VFLDPNVRAQSRFVLSIALAER